MKVHRITLLVVDHDDLGAGDVGEVLEHHAHYPNDCISPIVVETQTREVSWSDDHPLNKRDTWRAEFERMFSGPPWDEPGHECSPMGGSGPPCDRCRRYYKNERARARAREREREACDQLRVSIATLIADLTRPAVALVSTLQQALEALEKTEIK